MKIKRQPDSKLHIFAKILLTAIYLWSGFFWSGVSVIYYIIEPDMTHIAVEFLISSALLLISLVLCWFRLYIWQFPFCVIGLAVYLQPAAELIRLANQREVYFKPSFELRYLPVIAFGVIALILFAYRFWQRITLKAAKQSEFDNSPTQSILEKRRDE